MKWLNYMTIELFKKPLKEIYFNKFSLYIFIFLIFIGAFHNFNGTKGFQYLFFNDYLNENAFKLSFLDSVYILNSNFFLPIFKYLNISLNNDYYSFSLYLFVGFFSVYCVYKIIDEFFLIKNKYTIKVIIIPLLFTNHFLLDYLPASIFIYHMNTATSIATQLIYPLILFTLRKNWIGYAIISSIMISLHFTVAWLPIIICSLYFIITSRNKILNYLWILIPLFLFLKLFIFSDILNTSYSYEESIFIIREIFTRVGSEGILNLQPAIRVIILYLTFPLSYLFIRNKIQNKDLQIFLYIIIFSSFIIVSIGTLWTLGLYIYYPKIQIALLYFARSMATYNMFFCLGLLVFILDSKLNIILKFALVTSIYIIGKTYFSSKGIIISMILIISLFSLYYILTKTKVVKFIDDLDIKSLFYALVFFCLFSHIYFINKYRFPEFDLWQLQNLNKWTNGHLLKKDYETKDALFKIRKCDDFNLIALDKTKSEDIYVNTYINFLTHKSTVFIEPAMLFGNIELYKKNIEHRDLTNEIINGISKDKTITEEAYDFILDNNINFLIPSGSIKKSLKYFDDLPLVNFSIDTTYSMFSPNKKKLLKIKNCLNLKN